MGNNGERDLLHLLARIGRDDETALAELVERSGPGLLRFSLRMLNGDRGAAEDLVQETFLRVWQARHRWAGETEAAASSYLFTIASRLCLNQRRRSARRPTEVSLVLSEAESEGAALPASDAPSPEDQLAESDFREALNEVLAELPAQQRAALLLRATEGLRYQEIAEILDTSAGAVESLLVRARGRIKERLSRWFGAGKP